MTNFVYSCSCFQNDYQFVADLKIKLKQSLIFVGSLEKPVFSDSSGLQCVFEKFRFRDGLLWTVGQTVEIKLHFRDGLPWTVPGGGGGNSQKNWVGACVPLPKTLTLFMT